MIYTWNIIGHDTQIRQIEYDIAHDNLAHAYLFSGPSRIGKFSAALMFAHILQCPNNFCHTCSTCQEIEKGSHSDTIRLEDDHESSVKIEQIRDLILRLNMSSRSAYKILIIQNIERMTPEAVNALLKTLEEPPPRTIFILTSMTTKSLLPTLVSRVRVIRFHRVSEDLLNKYLTDMFPDIANNELKEIAFFSFGKPGQGAMLASDPDLLQYYRDLYSQVRIFLTQSSIADKFLFTESLTEDSKKMQDFLDVLTASLRHLVLTKKSDRFIRLIEDVHEVKRLLKRNINAKLAIENLMLNF